MRRTLLTLMLCMLSSLALAGEVTLSWQPPTQNEDGTALASCAVDSSQTCLDGYKLYWGTTAGGPYDLGSYTEQNSQTLTHTVTGLADGTYYFVATAFNKAGTESKYSNEAVKTVTTAPNPPTLTVQQDTTAYTIIKQHNKLVLLPVGTAPAGTVCDPAYSANGLNVVPVENVQWSSSNNKFIVVVAQCG